MVFCPLQTTDASSTTPLCTPPSPTTVKVHGNNDGSFVARKRKHDNCEGTTLNNISPRLRKKYTPTRQFNSQVCVNAHVNSLRHELLIQNAIDAAWLRSHADDSRYPTWLPLEQSIQQSGLVERLRLNREIGLQPDQMLWRQHSTIDNKRRMCVIDWMQMVSYDFSMSRHAVHLAISYFNRCLGVVLPASAVNLLAASAASETVTPVCMFVSSSNDMAVAATCLWIAAKLEEMRPAQAADFVRATANQITVQQMMSLERTIMHVLHWKVRGTTVFECLRAYLAGVAESMHVQYNEHVTAISLELDLDELSKQLPPLRLRLLESLQTTLATHTLAKAMQIADVFSMHSFSMHFRPSHVASAVMYMLLPGLQSHVGKVTGLSMLTLEPILTCFSMYAQRLPPVTTMNDTQKHQAERLRIPVDALYTRQVIACAKAPAIVWEPLSRHMEEHEARYLSPSPREPLQMDNSHTLDMIINVLPGVPTWSIRRVESFASDLSRTDSPSFSSSSGSSVSSSRSSITNSPVTPTKEYLDGSSLSFGGTSVVTLSALRMSNHAADVASLECHETFLEDASVFLTQ